MKPDSNAPKPSKKVFDVTRPGKTTASATSRPVIANRQAVKDQDFAADRGTGASGKSSLLNPKRKITVQPQDDAGKPDASGEDTPRTAPRPAQEEAAQPAAAPDAAPAKTDTPPPTPEAPIPAPGAPALKEQPDTQPSRQEEAPNLGSTALDGTQTAADDPQGTSAPHPPAETTAAPAAEDAEHTPEHTPKPAPAAKSEPAHMNIPKGFAEKVVVSNHRKHQNLWPEILAILIILLLLAAIANFLLDAAIITTNLDIPHTDFFDS